MTDDIETIEYNDVEHGAIYDKPMPNSCRNQADDNDGERERERERKRLLYDDARSLVKLS